MNSFLKNWLVRRMPTVYPVAEAEAPLIDDSMLESVKAAVESYSRETASAGNLPFSEVRQAGSVLEMPAVPSASPVRLYGELEAALGLLRLVPGARARRSCEEIELYMDKLRAAVQNRDSIL